MSNYNRGGGGGRNSNNQRRNGPATLPEEPPFTAFIGHLPQGIIQSDIEHIFDECGISQVRMVYDKIDNKFKGYCYVEFTEQAGLVKALEYNGANIEGKTMKVDIAEQKRDNRRNNDRGDNRRNNDGDRRRQNSRGGGRGGGNNGGGGFDNYNRQDSYNSNRGNYGRMNSSSSNQDYSKIFKKIQKNRFLELF